MSLIRRIAVVLIATLSLPCLGAAADAPQLREVTLLFTNDLESAFDPIPAWWRDDLEELGGVAHLATLIERERASAPLSFLFDAGDIFTGSLTRRTGGTLPFELMITMGYDAMCIGNHEFEYGWEVFREAAQLAPFPVLAANVVYAGTDIPFLQPYAVLERDGFRVGVIGVIGLDAATALIPSHVAGLEFRDPVAAVRSAVARLRPGVDLIVLLAHQGWTAPMQTDAEARAEVQRDIAADLALAGAVAGIDVMLCGHADAGTERPVVAPVTGTLVMQTYGHGTRLGRLRLTVDTAARRVVASDGELLLVDPARLPAHPRVAAKIAAARARFPELAEIVGHAEERLVRDYVAESGLGNLCADILRERTGASVGLMPSGALRGDLPAGPISRETLLDVFPFTDRIELLELSGEVLLRGIEQGLSLERGVLQVSGIEVRYDRRRAAGNRILSATVAGVSVEAAKTYAVATITMLAQGGDRYRMLGGQPRRDGDWGEFAAALEDVVASRSPLQAPARGRLITVAQD
jgi:2',3'-cyclic-nucleotide 2'-phosphodiesterase (5'-nucleotidase family)